MNINSNMLEVILNSTISISELTKAGAKKIFDGLSKDNSKIVLRNNKPVAALISPDRYQDLLEKEEDLQFLAESAAADACAPGNPKDASVEDFKELFRKIM